MRSGRRFIVISSLLAVHTLSLAACRDNFDDFVPDPLSADWELESVEGVADCTATGGTLQVVEVQDVGFQGDFTWTASCTSGENIAKAGDITGVEVDMRGADYGIDILLHTPETEALDWDCTMSGDTLNCVESGAVVVIYEFRKQG